MNTVTLRHQIHRNPELANLEVDTAKRLIQYFESLGTAKIITNIGGTGFAVCFGKNDSCKTIMLRSELDAVPIQEPETLDYHSLNDGVSHKCGHDGHMAILAAVGEQLAISPPQTGRVILLFQPAEETAEGARRILEDDKFKQLNPDYIFALHNVPGFPMGDILIKSGTFCGASQGLIINLKGKPAHAAQPETGNNPVSAVADLLSFFEQLPESMKVADNNTFVTVVGVEMGGKAFGITASEANIYITLRSETNKHMEQMSGLIQQRVKLLSAKHSLEYKLLSEDVFDATVNHPLAVEIISKALDGENINIMQQPFRWSEDFGFFNQQFCGAIFGIGAGEDTPDLHNSNYDFPDELIKIAAEYFVKIIHYSLK